MHIQEIKINGFGTFSNFETKLDKSLNIIVGTNGTGKTQFIKLLYAVFHDQNKLKKMVVNCANNKIYVKICLDDKITNKINKIMKLYYLLCKYDNFSCDNLAETFEQNDFIGQSKELEIELKINSDHGVICAINFGHKCSHNYLCTHKINDNMCEICKIYNISRSADENIINREKIKKIFDDTNILDYYRLLFIDDEYLGIQINAQTNDNYEQTYERFHNYISRCGSIEKYKIDMILNCLVEEMGNIFLDDYINTNELSCFYEKIKEQQICINYDPEILCGIYGSINNEYKLRHELFKLKTIKSTNLYPKIKQKYQEITGKEFDIFHNDNKQIVQDYELCNDGKYELSKGEHDLVYFLANFFGSSHSMLLLDEPCTRLSHQNKYKILELIKSKNDKQLIMVTHDKEFIDSTTCKSLLHFRLENDKTICTTFNNLADENKLIIENPEILFIDKCLCVEGYLDNIVIRQFCKAYDITEYPIIQLNGCKSKLPQILDKLKIKYKIIYDLDKICTKEQKNFLGKKIDATTFRFVKDYLSDDTIFEGFDKYKLNNKLIDIDEFIAKLRERDKYYIFNSIYEDLEGYCKLLFNDNELTKKMLKTYTSEIIYDKIKNNINNGFGADLKSFISNL